MCDLSLYVLSILLVKFTLIPKTLTLVLLKALIRTNDNCGFLFKLPFNGAGFAFGDELPLLLKTPIRNSAGFLFKVTLADGITYV